MIDDKDLTVDMDKDKNNQNLAISPTDELKSLLSSELQRLKGEKTKKLSKEAREGLLKEVKRIPISDIVLSRIPANERGECLCPFHNDTKTGSFQYSDKFQTFNCFTCDTKGDGITFVQKLENKSFNEANYELATQFGLMDKELFKELTGKDFNIETKEYTPVGDIKISERNRNNIEITDFFFNYIKSNSILGDVHKNYLLGRGLTPQEIQDGGYFTLFKNKDIQENALNSPAFADELKRVLKNSTGSSNYNLDNIRVPGVYRENGKFKLSEQVGLAIPIRDVEGKIQALQIRRDKVNPGEVRYLWYSTSGKDTGATPGTPIDSVIPRDSRGRVDISSDSLCFVEGRFKAGKISSITKAPVMSVQGVQNIQELDKNLKEFNSFARENNLNITTARIFYDMDMYKNLNVYDAMIKLIDDISADDKYKNSLFSSYVSISDGKIDSMPTSITELDSLYKEEKNIFVEVWDPRIGKGADDFLENGGQGFMSIKAQDFINDFNTVYLEDKDVKRYFELRDDYNSNKRAGIDDSNLTVQLNELDSLEPVIENRFVEIFIDNKREYETPESSFLEVLEEK